MSEYVDDFEKGKIVGLHFTLMDANGEPAGLDAAAVPEAADFGYRFLRSSDSTHGDASPVPGMTIVQFDVSEFLLKIDTSLVTYEIGCDFWIVFVPPTKKLDGRSVRRRVGHFSVQNRYQDKAGYSLTVEERNEIAKAHLDMVDGIQKGVTVRQGHRQYLASACGNVNIDAQGNQAMMDPSGTIQRATAQPGANNGRDVLTRDYSDVP